jgi:hypothetical protein
MRGKKPNPGEDFIIFSILRPLVQSCETEFEVDRSC